MTTDGLLSVTNWLYLISLFVAAVASVGLWRLSIASSEEKDRQLEQYKTDKADELERYKTDAGKLIAQANERAGDANKEAGRANERAGQLEKEAAQLRLAFEQEQVKRLQLEKDLGIIKPQVQSLLPKRIPPEKFSAFVLSLASSKGTLNVLYDMGQSTTRPLADDIARGATEAGWAVRMGSFAGRSKISKSGVVIETSARSPIMIVRALKSALSSVGIDYELETAPQGSTSDLSDEIVVIVTTASK